MLITFCPGWGSNPRPSAQKFNTLPCRHKSRIVPQDSVSVYYTYICYIYITMCINVFVICIPRRGRGGGGVLGLLPTSGARRTFFFFFFFFVQTWISLFFGSSRFCQLFLWVCQFEQVLLGVCHFPYVYFGGVSFKMFIFGMFFYIKYMNFGLCLVNVIKIIFMTYH